MAIGRLQLENEHIIQEEEEDVTLPAIGDTKEKDTTTFLTKTNIDDENAVENIANSQALVEQNILATSQKNKKKPKSQTQHKRTQSHQNFSASLMAPGESRYKRIPSENIKFQQFIDLIFESKMPKEGIKFEILSFVQALETNLNEAIRDERLRCERIKKELRKEKSKHVNDNIEKGDLENLFVDCVEDVRRNVIKRRLKAEIVGKKKIGRFDENSEEAQEFEESLLKLANLAKDRVKFSEFTTQDRNNLLDLFVNNEQTLLKVYEILFPKKAAHGNNSLRQLNTLKNSSDSIRFGVKNSEFLKGDSIHQRSIDETQAATDLAGNSTILPSIMPAMHSIQSNDLMYSLKGGQSAIIDRNSPGGDRYIQDSSRFANNVSFPQNQYHMNTNEMLRVGALNQRSVQNVGNNTIAS